MSINYQKVIRVADRAAGRSPAPVERWEVTTGQTLALGAVHASLLRLERTRADVDQARANNDDPMRKNVRVPWGEFFRALDQHTAHVRTLLAAFNVQ